MPSNAPVMFTPGSLPPNYCFTTWQQLYIDMISQLSGFLPGNYSTFNFGNAVPSPDDQDKPWFRLNGDSSPDKWYVYFGGSWVSPHPTSASSSELRLWKGLEADLVTYDGGAAGAVTDTTGPMWVVDHAMDARFPLAPGTLPSAVIIAVGDTGGEEKHLLLSAETGIVGHNHAEMCADAGNNAIGGGGANRRTFGVAGSTTEDSLIKTGSVADASALNSHNNMPPYIGRFFIQRTARKFYTP